MAYATKQMQVPVTYTEAGVGSSTNNFLYWVLTGTLAAQQASASACATEQFKAMVAAGHSTSFGSITEVATRANSVPQTW